MKDFKKYAEQARKEFVSEISKYTVSDNLALRTKADSLLIAFDQAVAKALIIDGVSQRSELLKALGKEIDIDLVSGKKCRILKTVEESYLIQENGNEQIRWVGVSEIKTKSL